MCRVNLRSVTQALTTSNATIQQQQKKKKKIEEEVGKYQAVRREIFMLTGFNALQLESASGFH